MKIKPIILYGTYKLEKVNSEKIKTCQIIPVEQPFFKSNLENWVCKQICGKHKQNVKLVESIKRLHRHDILNITDYMFARLSGTRATAEDLNNFFAEALVELNLDLKDLRKIDQEKLAKINNSFPYKRK